MLSTLQLTEREVNHGTPGGGTARPDLPKQLEQIIARGPAVVLDANTFPPKTARVGDSVPSEDDAEWSRFPRSKRGIAHALVLTSSGFSLSDWYRSAEVNPFDRYIPRPQRQFIEPLVREYVTHFAQVKNFRLQALTPELLDAVRRGLATKAVSSVMTEEEYARKYPRSRTQSRPGWSVITGGPSIANTSKDDRGPVAGVMTSTGSYELPMSKLPTATSANEYLAFKQQELAALVMSWFIYTGACPESRFSEVFKTVEKLSKTQLGRKD